MSVSGTSQEAASSPTTELERRQATVAAELDRRRADRYRRYQRRARSGRLAEESGRQPGVPAEGGTMYSERPGRRALLARLLRRS